MSNRAWMPLHIDKYLADTGHLTVAEHGAYMLLIMHYWKHGGLPGNERLVSRVAKMTADQWAESRDVLAMFFQDGWRHKRIDAELAKADDIIEKRRSAANERHQRSKSGAHAVQVDSTCSDTRVPPRTFNQIEEPSVPCPKPAGRRISYTSDFEEAWKAFPTDKIMSKKEAFDAWRRLDTPDREACAAAIPAFAAYCRAHPDYRPIHMCRFIAKRRFDGFAPQGAPDPQAIERHAGDAEARKAYWLAQLAQDTSNEASSPEIDMGRDGPDADAGQLSGCEEREFRRKPVGCGGRGGPVQGADEDGLRPCGEDEAGRGQPTMVGLDAVSPSGRQAGLRGRGAFQPVGGLAGQILAGAGGIPAAGE